MDAQLDSRMASRTFHSSETAPHMGEDVLVLGHPFGAGRYVANCDRQLHLVSCGSAFVEDAVLATGAHGLLLMTFTKH